MMAGLTDLFQPVGVFVDPLFSHLTVFPPDVAILIMAIILTSIIILVGRLVVNRKVMMQVKENMEEIKERLNKAQKSGDKKEQEKYLNELMQANSGYMKHTMKIMVVSIVVVMLLFPWLSYRYSGVSAVELPFVIPLVNWNHLEWLYWYILSAFAAGTIMRKIMGSDI